MLTQTLGKCLLLLGTAAWGASRAVHLKKRVQCLRDVLTALEILERELSFSLLPISELLSRAAEGTRGEVQAFLISCAIIFREQEEESRTVLWRRNLEKAGMPLTPEDISIFMEVGEILGRYDEDSQKAALIRLRARLEENLQRAREEAERMGKVYGTLGMTVGLFLWILL